MRSDSLAQAPSAAPSVGSDSENFGWVLTIALVVPGTLVVTTLLVLLYVRAEQWSLGTIYGSFVISISFVAALTRGATHVSHGHTRMYAPGLSVARIA
jgi:hypothetical protein